jgi:hypothetical protein
LKKKWMTWTIFALKNFWWRDKSEVDNKVSWDIIIKLPE